MSRPSSVLTPAPAEKRRPATVEAAAGGARHWSWPYVWLGVAILLSVVANGLLIVPVAAWICPVFLVRFLRTQQPIWGLGLAAVLMTCAAFVNWWGMVPVGAASPPQSLCVVDEHGKEHNISEADLAKLPRVKSKVTGHDSQPAEYEGVQLSDLLQRQGIALGKELRGPRIASYLLLEAEDGYRVVLAIAEVDPATTDKVVLLADRKNGAVLPDKEGPWRIIIPDEKRPVRWIRMLKRITIESAIPADSPK
jgi:molybdopterin-dependent oxidoreductase-like protein protein